MINPFASAICSSSQQGHAHPSTICVRFTNTPTTGVDHEHRPIGIIVLQLDCLLTKPRACESPEK